MARGVNKLILQQGGPKADNLQRKSLLNRVHEHGRKHIQEVYRSELAAGRTDDRPDPPEIAAARKLVDDYDERIRQEWEDTKDELEKVEAWMREQILFAPAMMALRFVKAYEAMTGVQALAVARTMADRNDRPPGLPGFVDTDITQI